MFLEHEKYDTVSYKSAIDIFTHLSLNTASSLFAQGLAKLTVIYDSNDQMSKEFLRDSFQELVTFVDVGLPDSEYAAFEPATRNCRNIIYLQNYFIVNPVMLLEIASKMPEYSAAFTLSVYTGGTAKELKDLRTEDLDQLTQR